VGEPAGTPLRRACVTAIAFATDGRSRYVVNGGRTETVEIHLDLVRAELCA
jgi:hypothetical protein